MSNKSKKEESFFEEESSLNKETIKSSNVGEYYNKNVLYKYKNGETCRVTYNSKDPNYTERIMS
jgi:hypothetical protein